MTESLAFIIWNLSFVIAYIHSRRLICGSIT